MLVQERSPSATKILRECAGEGSGLEVVKVLGFRFSATETGRSETISAVVEASEGRRFVFAHRWSMSFAWQDEPMVAADTMFVWDAVDKYIVMGQGEIVEPDTYIWRDAVWKLEGDNYYVNYVHGGDTNLLGEVVCQQCGTMIDVSEGRYELENGWICWACDWVETEGEEWNQ